ncbi:MAG TPA: rod shape-determining protein MreD [Sedimentisphaerales bacterium]|nr:rod shape-determining protein MreD [Sedimentisphaerales bacterium]
MHPVRLALVIVMTAVLQMALNNLLDFSFRPDFPVILLVFLATMTDGSWPIICAFAVGFATDLISLPVGPHTIAFGICGSFLALSRRSMTFGNPILIALAIFVFGCVGGAFAQVLISFRQPVPPGAYLDILWASLASAVIGPYIYSILSAISGFLGIHQGRQGRRGT